MRRSPDVSEIPHRAHGNEWPTIVSAASGRNIRSALMAFGPDVQSGPGLAVVVSASPFETDHIAVVATLKAGYDETARNAGTNHHDLRLGSGNRQSAGLCENTKCPT